MKKTILKILIILAGIVLIYNTRSYCVESGTKRIEITGGDPWVNINISESYAECESLNSASSTLGTPTLRAHLTTDADWSAMAMFSASQYGGATTNKPTTTNGNASGIYNPGRNITQTTGILNTITAGYSSYVAGLFNSDGSLKPYMRAWLKNRTETNFVGFNETYGWFNSGRDYGNTDTPISLKTGLFGIYFCNGGGGHQVTGGPFSNTTFRPVIWN